MKKTKFTEQQIGIALLQVESGMRVAEVCRKLGISQQTFYRRPHSRSVAAKPAPSIIALATAMVRTVSSVNIEY